MKSLKVKSDPGVEIRFRSYPDPIRKKLTYLRKLILEAADEIDTILEIEETLKWGEPSYLVKKGSTVRIDWKAGKPDQYAMYFKCTSKLVPTFKEVFGPVFNYENTRAILFGLKDKIPEKELKQCISLALKYHTLKDQPLLGL